jgi:NAD(P)-dependent dehydrogenase (short-subunit alcohol dehydrogenase family)
MSEQFQGKNAIVTGASRGIGAATARRLAAEGANVAVVARRQGTGMDAPGTLAETAEQAARYGTSVALIEADIADPAARAEVVPRAIDALGGAIDILVNNAATNTPFRLLGYADDRRQHIFELNVFGPLDLVQAVAPTMVERGEGWIVNVGSGTARIGGPPPFRTDEFGIRLGMYGTTKAALDRLTYALALELYGTGVRVNCVRPRAAVASEGAVYKGLHLPEDYIESMEAMVEAIVSLCEAPEDLTGRVTASLDLLEETGRTVMELDGRAPYPGGFRRVLA